MDILVIGNGFDLAHGLPTRYADFLEFCEKVSKIFTYHEITVVDDYIYNNLKNWGMNDYIKGILIEAFSERICKENPYKNDDFNVECVVLNEKINDDMDDRLNDLDGKRLTVTVDTKNHRRIFLEKVPYHDMIVRTSNAAINEFYTLIENNI